jgi:hypothetical protein
VHGEEASQDLVRSTFGWGLRARAKEIVKHYSDLPEKERLRLTRVAWRARAALMLRYQVVVRHDRRLVNQRWQFVFQDLPMLETYLLFTCLEALAARAYRPFPKWLEENFDTKVWTLDDMRIRYVEYQDACGVTKNIKRLFDELPRDVKSWLMRHVALESRSAPFQEPETDETKILGALYQYFYRSLRNPFTHEGESPYVLQSWSSALDPDWWSFISFLSREKHEWALSFRSGLDPATVLRVIIQAVVLQLLGIEVTAEVVADQVNGLLRQATMYGFLREIEYNASLLRQWLTLDQERKKAWLSELIVTGFEPLRDQASTALAAQFVDVPLERSLRQQVDSYLAEVRKINAAIGRFNGLYPHVDYQLTQEESATRVRAAEAFLAEQVNSEACDFIVSAPGMPVWGSLRVLARSPCYA